MSLSLAFLLLSLAPQTSTAGGGPQALSWRILKPSNTGLPGDFVHTIHLEDDDDPWIPAYIPIWEEGGMAHWDGTTWRPLSSVDHPVILSPRFNDVESDASGVLWIATDEGLLRFDPAVGPASLQRYDVLNAPIPGDRMSALALAPDGTLWIAIREVASSPPGGLARFDPATGTWSAWTTQNGLPWGAAWPGWDWIDFVGVVPDAEGYTVWFGNDSQGMATWRNGVFRWLQSPAPGQPLPRAFLGEDPVDAQGNAWMLTSQGLARRSPSGSFLVTGYPFGLSSEISVVNAIDGGRALAGTYYADVFLWDGTWSYLGNWGSGNHTYAVAEDSQGRVWAGGIGGSARLEAGGWQRYRLTNTGMLGYWVQAIDFDAAGNVYIEGNAGPGVGGFSIFDGVHWTNANAATYGLGLPWPFPSDSVTALCARADGTLAFSPYAAGIRLLDGTSFSTILANGLFEHLVEDGAGRLWAAGDGGLTRIAGAQVAQFSASGSPLPAGDFAALAEDLQRPGFVWAFTRFGVAHTDGEAWSVYPRELLGLTQNTTSELIYAGDRAPDGTLWIGSGKGVFHLDPATGVFTQHTRASSALPSNDVTHVEVAPDGTAWVATFDSVYPYPGGLTHLFPGGSRTYHTGNSPLPHDQIWELATRAVPGGYELWVGTASEGVAVVDVRNGLRDAGPVRPR